METKIIGGKKYSFVDFSFSKDAAQRKAQKIRSPKVSVRITTLDKSVYEIWSRRI